MLFLNIYVHYIFALPLLQNMFGRPDFWRTFHAFSVIGPPENEQNFYKSAKKTVLFPRRPSTAISFRHGQDIDLILVLGIQVFKGRSEKFKRYCWTIILAAPTFLVTMSLYEVPESREECGKFYLLTYRHMLKICL
jgi:hypothetical protein